jgi:hypothetical protein
MSRTLSINSIFVGYSICGVILAFFDLRIVGSSEYANFISTSFPVIESFSIKSIDPDHWRGYYTAMVTLMLAFLPPLWLACERERKVVARQSKILAALLVVLCLTILWALTHFHDGVDHIHEVDSAHGKLLLLLVMLKYRAGLAVVGTMLMTGGFVLFFIVAVAAPQALLFQKK